MKTIAEIRADFPILEREIYGKPLIYLDNGATTQKPRCVIDTINVIHLLHHSNIHRGVHFLSDKMSEMYEA
jgi:cysteine desulfurase/selenocysteine lyase